MSKKPSLAAALHQASGRPAVSAASAAPSPTAPARGSGAVPPSRQGKKALTGFFDPAVSRAIKQLALNEDKTVQALLTEALNDLLVKYGRTPIAS